MDADGLIERIRERARRRQKALEMRKDNKTLREIGEALGVTRERARQLVAEAIAENKR